MTSAVQCRHQHSYRLSAYERKANDFYPTPSDVAVGLALGLPRLGLDLPRVALDPCSGDGALRRSLAPFGVDVRLTDLYPERHPESDGYIASQPLDATEAEHLHYACDLAGSDCDAIITNTPHNTDEACLAGLGYTLLVCFGDFRIFRFAAFSEGLTPMIAVQSAKTN
jgi:hypothetical protein